MLLEMLNRHEITVIISNKFIIVQKSINMDNLDVSAKTVDLKTIKMSKYLYF